MGKERKFYESNSSLDFPHIFTSPQNLRELVFANPSPLLQKIMCLPSGDFCKSNFVPTHHRITGNLE